jgi:hypothetical protein
MHIVENLPLHGPSCQKVTLSAMVNYALLCLISTAMPLFAWTLNGSISDVATDNDAQPKKEYKKYFIISKVKYVRQRSDDGKVVDTVHSKDFYAGDSGMHEWLR